MIVEKRADGKVETEATIKIWANGERYVRTGEGNGPVHALDNALRSAIGESHPELRDTGLVNFKVRILDETKGTEAVTRVLLDASDGHDVWGSIGVSENVIEASWDALVDSLEYAIQPGRAQPARAARPARRRERRTHGVEPGAATPSDHATPDIPLAQPVLGAEEEAAVIEVLRSGQLSLGPRVPAFEQAFAARLGVAMRLGGLQRHRRPAPRAARGRRGGGRRGRHEPVLVRRLGERDPLRARQAGVRRHRPGHAQPRPGGRRRGDHRPHEGAAARAHLRLPGRPARVRGACGLPIVEDACEALGAVHADGVPVGGRGHPAVFGFYANKQLTTGEGGMVALGDAAMKERIDSERNQGRAPDMGWLDHDRLGFNYRLTDIASRDRPRAARAARRHARRPRARRRLVPRGARRDRGPDAAVPGRGRQRARLVRLRRPAPARRRPRRDRARARRSAGSRASRTCRRST